MGPGGFNDAKSDNGSSFASYNKRSGPVIHVDKLLKGSLKSISTTYNVQLGSNGSQRVLGGVNRLGLSRKPILRGL